MDSNSSNSNSVKKGSVSPVKEGSVFPVKEGSVFPVKNEHVSTKVGKKVVELAEKAVKSAYKNRNDKAKVNPKLL